jgi:hypothetical protein
MNDRAYAAADLVAPDDAGATDDAALALPAGQPRPLLAALLARLPRHSAAPRRYDGTELTPRRLVRALSRRSRARALARLRRLPCFRAEDYLRAYPDVRDAGMDPHRHALFIGGFEERRLFRLETLASRLGAALPATPADAPVPSPLLPVAVHVSSRGNIFMREIAEDVAAGLRAAGAAADVLDETAPIGARTRLRLFVAPHEFFFLGRGVDWVREDVVSAGVMLNTEQPQTRWFGRALPFLLAARGVIDLCPQSAALFAATGMPSLELSPAPLLTADALTEADRLHPLFRVLPAAARTVPSADTPFAARPLDFSFFGSESRHREEFFSRHAGALAEFEGFIHYRREDRGPIRPGTPDGALTRLARHVGGHAKIVLNLHRDAFGYLEWHRIVRLGVAAGAVVVSEPCLPHPLLTPGVHYFAAPGRQIPGLLAWLIRDADGRRAAARVQAGARALLADVVTPVATGARVLAFLHAQAGRK